MTSENRFRQAREDRRSFQRDSNRRSQFLLQVVNQTVDSIFKLDTTAVTQPLLLLVSVDNIVPVSHKLGFTSQFRYQFNLKENIFNLFTQQISCHIQYQRLIASPLQTQYLTHTVLLTQSCISYPGFCIVSVTFVSKEIHYVV